MTFIPHSRDYRPRQPAASFPRFPRGAGAPVRLGTVFLLAQMPQTGCPRHIGQTWRFTTFHVALPPWRGRQHNNTTKAVVTIAITGIIRIAIRRGEVFRIIIVPRSPAQHPARPSAFAKASADKSAQPLWPGRSRSSEQQQPRPTKSDFQRTFYPSRCRGVPPWRDEAPFFPALAPPALHRSAATSTSSFRLHPSKFFAPPWSPPL